MIDLAADPATGRRRQKSKGGFPTKKSAEEAMRDAISRGTGGTGVGVRLGDYLDEWLEAATHRLRETTAGGYARAVTDIKEGLGAVRLRDLTPLMIERFYAELSRTGGRQGTGLSPKSIRNYHVTLRKVLADAERLEVIDRNPASRAKAPTTVRPRRRRGRRKNWVASSATRRTTRCSHRGSCSPPPACAEVKPSVSDGATSTSTEPPSR